MSERDIQKTIFAYLSARRIPAIHVPNERGAARTRGLGSLVAEGLVPGAPDLIIGRPFKRDDVWHPGLLLELKAPGGRVRQNQIEFLRTWAAEGWATAIAYGVDEAIAAIVSCYGK